MTRFVKKAEGLTNSCEISAGSFQSDSVVNDSKIAVDDLTSFARMAEVWLALLDERFDAPRLNMQMLVSGHVLQDMHDELVRRAVLH